MTAERAGALMMRLRELSLAAGDPGNPVTTRRAGPYAVSVCYLLGAVAAVLIWRAR